MPDAVLSYSNSLFPLGKPVKPIQKASIEFAGREFSRPKYWQSASAVKANLSDRPSIFRSPTSSIQAVSGLRLKPQ
jgi:hypothetical protein